MKKRILTAVTSIVFLILLSILTPTVNAGEIINLFNHQQILKGGYKDPKWAKLRSKRKKTNIEIGYEISGGFCRKGCPSYSVIFQGNGEFIYVGEHRVKRKGLHKGRIPMHIMKKLIQYTKDIHFFSFRNRYSMPISDSRTTYTYVLMNKSSKVISNYYDSAPAKVWALEILINQILKEDAIWDK